MDENDERSFPKQLDDMHAELFRRGSSARGRAARQYNKAVREVKFEKGQRVLLFYPPGLTEEGRKLRSPWLGPYVVQERLSPIAYVLRGEVSGEIARTHVNRLRRISDQVIESERPQAGVYPDSRRLAMRLMESKLTDGVR